MPGPLCSVLLKLYKQESDVFGVQNSYKIYMCMELLPYNYHINTYCLYARLQFF